MDYKKQRVSYTGYGVYKYPEGLEGWRCGRLEYGGSNEDCFKEIVIWLPPTVDPYAIVKLINDSQKSENYEDPLSTLD